MTRAQHNVLLIGGGGREHALARRLCASARLAALHVTHPENPGLARMGRAVDVPVNAREVYRLQQYCDRHDISLVVIGPEDPLAEGFADALARDGRLVFGPSAAGARLESDKAWCKALMRQGSIPTAEGRAFTDHPAACEYFELRSLDIEERERLADLERVRSAEARRAAIDALMRVGSAVLDRGRIISADETLLRNCGLFERGVDDEALRARARVQATIARRPRPVLPVIKASGLCKGKGVTVPGTIAEGLAALEASLLRKVFGDAGRTVLIEERLSGPEVSVLALVDGRNILVLPVCQDHKRLLDGDKGPNTGGMGAYCPAPLVNDAAMSAIEREILVPTVDCLRREGIEYRGVMYAGLMLTHAGPKVLEFNCRFGDPECQPLMARLRSDLIDLLEAACLGRLDRLRCEWDPRAACCVVLASDGYPDAPRSGQVIEGLEAAEAMPGVVVDLAGAARDAEGRIVSKGGRVVGVTGLGDSLAAARARAYEACEVVRFAGRRLRRDIGAQGA
ncbi:MAG: phosphoribosylamine--glycine ligase [Phycisphaerales bacterium]|nr:phosphoribosylamine--glycine ligase [Phycisphaerales bacterium]